MDRKDKRIDSGGLNIERKEKKMECKAIFEIEFLAEKNPLDVTEKIAKKISEIARFDHGGISIEECKCLRSPQIIDMTKG